MYLNEVLSCVFDPVDSLLANAIAIRKECIKIIINCLSIIYKDNAMANILAT
ncbi:hypothetical protein PPRY_b0208 [Pseudoalteromonas prydzensis ACAM 620]|nr:hypothetical protein [Pseudoalteromonas prydzensis ACAM 620]